MPRAAPRVPQAGPNCRSLGWSRSLTFTTDCLAAPVGEPFTIEFNNQDTSSHRNHNIHILDGDDLFDGDSAPHGTSITYEVAAMEAGSYEFRCDEHPFMNGAFIVS
jgi:plastocyanin